MIALALGILVLACAWSGPLAGSAAHSFTAHMLMHVAVVAVAAPLLAWGMARQFAPAVRSCGTASRLPGAPVIASVAEFVVIWGWHLPAAHAFARTSLSGLFLEQASFLATALWLWLSVLWRSDRHAAADAAGVFALLLTSMHMVLLGTLLTLAPRPLYEHASSIDDLHAGGLVMLAGGSLPYLAGGLLLVARMLAGGGSRTPGPTVPRKP